MELVGCPIPNLGTIIPKMGMKKTSLGEALFGKTQRRVLGLLFGNPDRSYYANEIVRLAGAGIGAVQRELERLETAQLITAHGRTDALLPPTRAKAPETKKPKRKATM